MVFHSFYSDCRTHAATWPLLLAAVLVGCSSVSKAPGNVSEAHAESAEHAIEDSAAAELSMPPSTPDVRIVSIYGPRSVHVNESANYRIRLADGADRPVIYRWQVEDGTGAEGNNITYRFEEPGEHLIIATARNRKGSDSDTLVVHVAERAPADTLEGEAPSTPDVSVTMTGIDGDMAAGIETTRPAPQRDPSFRGRRAIAWSEGGYTLLAASASGRSEAEAAALSLQRRGLRAGLYLETSGPGSAIYRVVVGQFATEEEAARARSRILAEGHEGAFLVHPLPSRNAGEF